MTKPKKPVAPMVPVEIASTKPAPVAKSFKKKSVEGPVPTPSVASVAGVHAKPEESTKATGSIERVLRVGNTVLIRTVTMYDVGRIEALYADPVPTALLSSASWVASTKRWSDTLKTGELEEVEIYPDGVCEVLLGAGVDAANWKHPLPTQSK